MTRLSVNVNKIATLRNARGGQEPNVVKAATRIQAFGADGITVHPRPDARHITYQDVHDLREAVHTEFNVEGYPSVFRDPSGRWGTPCSQWDPERYRRFTGKDPVTVEENPRVVGELVAPGVVEVNREDAGDV